MIQVALLADAPGRPRLVERIGAAFDDCSDPLAESLADIFKALAAAVVLGRVVQQGRDRLVLVTARLEDQRAHCHGMRDVRSPSTLTRLVGMHLSRVAKALFDAVR